jgi:hypothetical protein
MTQNILAEIVPRRANLQAIRTRAGPGSQNVLERQQLLLCGKHAINHILQENKVEWDPRKQELLITGSRDPLNRDTRINLSYFCMSYFQYFRDAHRIPANGRMPDCDLVKGNISSDVIQVFFSNLLHYRVDAIYFAQDRPTALRSLATRLGAHDCLGAIINIGGNHWTAISQYLNSCRKRVAGRLEKFTWAYIDSLSASIYECTDYLDEIFAKYGGRFVQAILIFNRPGNSYYSIATERMGRKAANNSHATAARSIRGIYTAPPLAAAAATAGVAEDNAATYRPEDENAQTYHEEENQQGNSESVVSYHPGAAVQSSSVAATAAAERAARHAALLQRPSTPGRQRPAAAAAAAAAPVKGILKKGGRTRRRRSGSSRKHNRKTHRR